MPWPSACIGYERTGSFGCEVRRNDAILVADAEGQLAAFLVIAHRTFCQGREGRGDLLARLVVGDQAVLA